MEDKKLEKKNEKVKKEWTVKRILTTVIIGILALLMVGGSFYYIFTPGFRKNANAFGFYDGEPVLFENNNVFGRTLMSDESYVTASLNGDYNTLYQSWYKAYQSQVVFIAFNKMAEKAGILAPQSMVSRMILDSGMFNGEDGSFDQAAYDAVSDSDKRYLFNYMQTIYPYQTVISDVFNVLTSAKETAFIVESSKNDRTFDYFVVGPNTYPDSLARDYVSEHKDYFKLVDMSMISCTSEDSAKACYDELNSGLAWSDAVAKYSEDSFASNDGKVGSEVFAYVFSSTLANVEDLSKITSLTVNSYTEPLEGAYAWTIYKLNDIPSQPDFYDQDILNQVKQIIYSSDADLVQPYIDNAVDAATVASKNDFDKTADIYGTGLVTVGPVANNIGNSMLLAGISAKDEYGYLAEAVATDETVNSDLFTNSVGYIAGPIEVEGSYIFVRATADSVDESIGQLTEAMFNYYKNQLAVVDSQNSVILSDKHEDNFINKFMEMFFGSSN